MGLPLDLIETLTSVPWSRQCKLGAMPVSKLLICLAKSPLSGNTQAAAT